MKFDVVTVGGATQDIFLLSDSFPVSSGKLGLIWGEKFVADDIFFDVGGGACNAAVGFARLGLKTALWCKVGRDLAGEFVEQRMAREKISPDFLDIHPEARTSMSVIFVGQKGERSIVMFRGQNDRLETGHINFENIFDTRWVFAAELTGNPTPFLAEIAAGCQKRGVKFAFVPGLGQLDDGINSLKKVLSATCVLIFNAYEAAKLLGRLDTDYRSNISVREMLSELAGQGVGTVVITKDIDGVRAVSGGKFFAVQAPKVEKVVDTTGAGDAFAAGFLSVIIRGGRVEAALEKGSGNAAAVIQKIGAQTGLLWV